MNVEAGYAAQCARGCMLTPPRQSFLRNCLILPCLQIPAVGQTELVPSHLVTISPEINLQFSRRSKQILGWCQSLVLLVPFSQAGIKLLGRQTNLATLLAWARASCVCLFFGASKCKLLYKCSLHFHLDNAGSATMQALTASSTLQSTRSAELCIKW